ncbi:MAG: NUDIX hydrolase [Treponema sp.]|jgi:8-oxo-dGTP pyrophosphatase MutT (NUDIX family)|nr:NUDIX hydrolase [Treponema sp.]
MSKKNLIWKEEENKEVFRSRIFSIRESVCRSPDNSRGTYTVIHSPDWVIVIPVLKTPQGEKFVMVRQWRHGSQELSLEFPGGVFETGEDAAQAAARELLEETAYKPGTIQKIGEFNPNPAIMSNRVHFFMAGDLEFTGKQELDEDEFIEVDLVDPAEVFRNLGQPPYIHALMGAACALYLQKTAGNTPSGFPGGSNKHEQTQV